MKFPCRQKLLEETRCSYWLRSHERGTACNSRCPKGKHLPVLVQPRASQNGGIPACTASTWLIVPGLYKKFYSVHAQPQTFRCQEFNWYSSAYIRLFPKSLKTVVQNSIN